MRNFVKLGLVAAVGAALAATAVAQEMKPDRAIKYRQGILQGMGWHMGVLGAMAKGERPYNKDEAVRSATFVSDLSQMAWDGFPAGSDQGAPTKAKPEIWKDGAKFKQYQDALKAETAKLPAAAGTLDGLKAALGPTGKACGNCHDDFRAK